MTHLRAANKGRATIPAMDETQHTPPAAFSDHSITSIGRTPSEESSCCLGVRTPQTHTPTFAVIKAHGLSKQLSGCSCSHGSTRPLDFELCALDNFPAKKEKKVYLSKL
jgi:hypothetical protein